MKKRVKGKIRGWGKWKIMLILFILVGLMSIIYGFVIGWGHLNLNAEGFGERNVNLETHINECDVACLDQSVLNYCSKIRNVVLVEGREAEKLTCFLLQGPLYGLSNCDSINSEICSQATVLAKSELDRLVNGDRLR